VTLTSVRPSVGTRRSLSLLVAVIALGCGRTITEDPRNPTGSSGGTLTPVNPIPAAPAPQPTPTPVPTPTPDFPPPAGGGGGDSGSCGPPTPPPLARIQVGVLIYGAGRLVLDSTPLVGPNRDYCQQIGFTDGRQFCPARPEGNPERGACEAGLVGRASDTGRIGPTWLANGAPCGSSSNPPFCQNHPDNQYLVFAYGSGTFKACAQNGICGEVVIP